MSRIVKVCLFTLLFTTQIFAWNGTQSWEALGPQGGSVRGIAVDPTDGSVFAASFLGGVFRLQNGNLEWKINGMDFGDFVPRASDVVFNPSDYNHMLAAVSRTIYYSPDRGESWNPTALYSDEVIREIKFLNDSAAFAYDNGSLYRTLDNGQIWSEITLPALEGSITSIDVDPAHNRLYLTSQGKLYYSETLGNSWTALTTPDDHINDIHVGPYSGKLYLLADSIYRSPDAVTWENISDGAPGIAWTIQEDVFSDSILYLGGGVGFYRWKESQHQWTLSANGIYTPQGGVNHFPTVTDIVNYPNSQGCIYIGTQYEGIFYSDDAGANWTRLGIPGAEMDAVELLPGADEKIIAGGTRGVWLYQNQDWEYSDLVWDLGGTTRRLAVKPDEPDVIFSAGQSGTLTDAKLNISTDGGLTWDTKMVMYGGFFWDFAFHPDSPDTVFAGLCPQMGNIPGIFYSTNGGKTPGDWSAVPNTNGFLVGGLGFSPANKSLYVVHLILGEVYKTSNNGASFQFLGTAPVPFEYYVSGLTFNSAGDKMYLYGPGVQVSENDGASWTLLGPQSGSMVLQATDFIIDPQNDSHFFVSGPTGIFESRDAGQNWTQIAADLPVSWTNSIALSADGEILYAATTGGSVFKINLDPATGIAGGNTLLPQDLVLQQNYPNPFNPETNISYRLPKSGRVSLKVYNSLGQEVEVLVDERQDAGRHQLQYNASRLPSGIYFYTLKFGKQAFTRQMVLMK